ncbi:uncharacterized protein V6R79_017679 [Siganus canaliculatus]
MRSRASVNWAIFFLYLMTKTKPPIRPDMLYSEGEQQQAVERCEEVRCAAPLNDKRGFTLTTSGSLFRSTYETRIPSKNSAFMKQACSHLNKYKLGQVRTQVGYKGHNGEQVKRRERLRKTKAVTCSIEETEGNMTFTSPTDVQSGCYMQALQHYVAGLKNSLTHCADINPMGKFYIKRVVQTLSCALQETETNCNFTMTTHQSFQQFVNAIDKFIPEFNQHQC